MLLKTSPRSNGEQKKKCGRAAGLRRAGGGPMGQLIEMADEAQKAGLLTPTGKLAALSLASQIARLEERYEAYYRLGGQDAEAMQAQCSPDALDKMGKCEKQLAELKARFFEMAGLDRLAAAKSRLAELQALAAEQGGEVVLKLEGFDPHPPGPLPLASRFA